MKRLSRWWSRIRMAFTPGAVGKFNFACRRFNLDGVPGEVTTAEMECALREMEGVAYKCGCTREEIEALITVIAEEVR